MTTEVRAPIFSDSVIRRARLGSGLVIFIFVTLHLSNHALGLISLEAAEKGRHWFVMLWRNPLGTTVFYGAVIVHVFLVLRSLSIRRTLTMPAGEAVQIFTGLLI